MNRISSFGQHSVYEFDIHKHKFLEFFQTLYETTELNMLHTRSDEFMKPAPFESWIPWFVDMFVDQRDDVMKFLAKHNIQTRATYPEINRTPMYLDTITHPISSYVSANGLFLPSHTLLQDTEIDHICKLIKFFCESLP
jgi:dTDP-4-amino-4,6-dideoxygalactose transaminase